MLLFKGCLCAMVFAWCRPKLKEHMQYCIDHPEEISKLAKVKAQVSEVKGVMMENIEKVQMLTTFLCWLMSYEDMIITTEIEEIKLVNPSVHISQSINAVMFRISKTTKTSRHREWIFEKN